MWSSPSYDILCQEITLCMEPNGAREYARKNGLINSDEEDLLASSSDDMEFHNSYLLSLLSSHGASGFSGLIDIVRHSGHAELAQQLIGMLQKSAESTPKRSLVSCGESGSASLRPAEGETVGVRAAATNSVASQNDATGSEKSRKENAVSLSFKLTTGFHF